MADVVIIGAGLAGAAAAWHLSRTHHVHLVDQASQVGAEASAQNAGMQRRLAHDPVERQLACRAGRWLADCPASFRDAIRPVGGLLLLDRHPTAFDQAASDLSQRGITVDDVTGAVPVSAAQNAPHTKAWWVPEEGLLDAHHLVSTFCHQARQQGARLSLETAVTDLLITGGRVTGVQTRRGPLHGDAVLLATGAWSGGLAKRFGLQRPLTPLARHLFHTTPHPMARATHPWVWVEDAGVYLRPEGGGWLCSPCDETLREPKGPGSAGPTDDIARALLQAKLYHHLPDVGEVRIRGGWTGLRTFAPDRRPLLGADPDLPGLFWATGLGGYGVTCSVAVGEAVSALFDGKRLDWLDVAAVNPGRRYRQTLKPAVSDLERYAS